LDFFIEKRASFLCVGSKTGEKTLFGGPEVQRPPCRKNNKSSRAVPTMKMQEGKNLQRNIANVIHADNTEA